MSHMRMGISLVENLLPHETVTAPESGSIPHHIRRMYAVTIGTRNENDRRLIEIAWRTKCHESDNWCASNSL